MTRINTKVPTVVNYFWQTLSGVCWFPEVAVFEDTEESLFYRKFLFQWTLKFKTSHYKPDHGREEEEAIKNKVWDTKTKKFVESKK